MVPAVRGAIPLLLGALLQLPAEARAQAVTGRVVADGSSAAVAGALVQLIDLGDAPGPRTLTRSDGAFSLLAPAPGSYRLQVDRIGFARHLSEPLELEAGTGREVTLRVTAQAITLQGITTQGQSRDCSIRSDGAFISRVWDEARKALQVVSLSQTEQLVRFDIQSFRRDRDPRTHQLRSEQRRARYGISENPFRSIPPEQLDRDGYIRAFPDSIVYYGPDAEVLLSEAFLESHCFRISGETGEPNAIGLEFRPIGRLSRPDIEGVMWLDRTTSELRSVEYRYVGHGFDVADGDAGGRIEFARVPSGAWIVKEWSIRMPVLVQERMQTFRGTRRIEERRTIVQALIDEGGEVTAAHAVGEGGTGAAGAGSVTGLVYDSIGGGLLAGAVVTLSGTSRSATTDPFGHFRLDGVPAGRHVLSFAHPLATAVGAQSNAREVVVRAGEEAVAALAIPSVDGLLRRYCPAEEAAGLGMIVGHLRAGGTMEPVAGAEVTAAWEEVSTRPDRVDAVGSRTIGSMTDADGLYRVCGVPPNSEVRLRAKVGEVGARRLLRTGAVRVVAEDLLIALP